jgi:hypothetical protein
VPTGSEGKRRPDDAPDKAAKIARVTTGVERKGQENVPALSPAQQLGKLGGAARAKKLTAAQRTAIAKKAAAKRWSDRDAKCSGPGRQASHDLSAAQ